MNRRTRLFSFPGGLFELECDGDETGNQSGFYLELLGFTALQSEPDDQIGRGENVNFRATALGYLRTDVSGIGQLWDESQIRSTAARLGYDLAALVIYDPRSGRPPFARLKTQATRLEAEAVIVPSLGHFEEGRIPDPLVRQLDVITISPEEVHRGKPDCKRLG